MRRVILAALALLAIGGLFFAPTPAWAQSYRGPTRVNFDERLIKGQTAKAGSVYIFDRQKLGEQRLVKRKRSFRLRTIRLVFPDAKE